MNTDQIREAADEMDEEAFIPAQYLLIAWNSSGEIKHHFSKRVGDDLMGHIADYRQALMKLNGAPGQVQ